MLNTLVSGCGLALDTVSSGVRKMTAWRSIDQNMPMVAKAFHKVRCELAEVGLLLEGSPLDATDLYVSPLPSLWREAGYVYEGETFFSRKLGYLPGMIYLPADLPRQAYVPGGTLVDVIRHEFAHSWHYFDADFFEEPWFVRTFGIPYDDASPTPGERWNERHLRRRDQQALDECASKAARELLWSWRRRDFVSDYATTLACEDFAETFMYFLRYRNSLDRFQNRKGLHRKLMAVQKAVARSARRLARI